MSNKRTLILALLVALCLLSCARVPQKGGEDLPVATSAEVPEWFDSDSLRTAYLFTEGVRLATLSENPSDTTHLDYFRRVLAIDSLHAPAHYYLARHYYERPEPDYSNSLIHSRKALEGDTTNLDYRTQYAATLVGMRLYEPARKEYMRLVQEDPKEPLYYRTAALLCSVTRLPHLGITLLDSASHKLGYIEELSSVKRRLLMNVGLYDRAAEELRSEIANTPLNPHLHIELGNVLAASKQDSLAGVSYNRALEIAPTNSEAQIAVAAYHLHRGDEARYIEALKAVFANDNIPVRYKIDAFENEISDAIYRRNYFAVNSLASILNIKYPDNKDVSELYATHLLRGGEVEEAIKIFKSLAEQYPEESFAGTVATIENYLGHTEEALHYIDKAIEHSPDSYDYRLHKAAIMIESGKKEYHKLTIKTLKEALKLAPDDRRRSTVETLLGDQFAPTNTNKALRHYRKAIGYNADNAAALNNLAYMLCELFGSDLAEALRLSTKAVELEPTNANYLDTKAWIFYRLGQYPEAKQVMRKALSLNSSPDKVFLLHYADILAALDDGFMAKVYYERALEAGANPELIANKIALLEGKKE